MALIDWSEVLPNFDLEVAYSSLETDDERDAFDGTVAELRILPGDYHIDVSWSPEDSGYLIRLYQGFFENVILFRLCKDVREVLLGVVYLADSTRCENTFTELDDSSGDIDASASNQFMTI